MGKTLVIPENYPFPDIVPDLSDRDTMFVADDFRHYLSVGLSALESIRQALADRSVDNLRILDMPCGFGRVARVLRAAYPQAELFVSDIDPDGVRFCSETFGATGLISQPDFNLLDFHRSFDLIWVGSLITHLPLDATRAFLALVLRHLAPNGVAVVSSHGPYVAGKFRGEKIHAQLLAEYFCTGFGYVDKPGLDLSIQRYGTAVISRDRLVACISSLGGEVMFYRDHTWDNHHDVVAFRKA